MSGDSQGVAGDWGEAVAHSGVVPQLRGMAATQLQLIDAMWECRFLVARSSYFREDSNRHFLCEIT